MIRVSFPFLLSALFLGPASTLSAASGSVGGAQDIYEQYCAACHAPENIMVSSPKLHNQTQWGERLKPGLDHVLDRAMTGFGAMPPMGLCDECTREEIEAVIRFMSSSADGEAQDAR